VQIVGCSIDFGSIRQLRFPDADFEGPALVALMGPSGSGKTTLLGLVSGRLTPSGGAVDVEPKTKPDWILQSSPLLTRRSALDNVLLGPRLAGRPGPQAFDRARSAMRELGVWELRDQPVFRLSGGERQRLAVARAMARGAQLVLADEPTASLDPTARALVCLALRRAATHGALVLVATHDDHVAQSADAIYRLEGDPGV
jgi:ABC-type lipoprotein export system ATPase subunit